MLKIGDKIRIVSMQNEPQYTGKEGVVTHMNKDPWGATQVWGTWGGCCIYENIDSYELIK